ncbi:DUF4172 domain-containing protein [Desulfovibrio sp. OttesenSCG-928-C06]|nr:DUF4172 domain-containing protein [Desulfovibrio sp. OttesenSCG-928-C06]
MRYIHQLDHWPLFRWDAEALSGILSAVRFRQGLLVGRMESLAAASEKEAEQFVLLLDTQSTRAIEKDSVKSGTTQNLKPDSAATRALKNCGEYAVARELANDPAKLLTASRLDDWHAQITGTVANAGSGTTPRASGWRAAEDGPKQLVYGPLGWEKVQFEAPDAARLSAEMSKFLAWVNFHKIPEPETATQNAGEPTPPGSGASLWNDGLIRAGLAQLWFITLHPYKDGSGRLARSITDLMLHRAAPVLGVSGAAPHKAPESGKRFYSLNERLLRERADYFSAISAAQRGNLDVTAWLDWFLHCLERAIMQAETHLAPILKKDFWRKRAAASGLNRRQALVFETMLGGYPREVSTGSYARMAETSQDTALRDIIGMIDLGLMRKTGGGGRSTSYRLKWSAGANREDAAGTSGAPEE